MEAIAGVLRGKISGKVSSGTSTRTRQRPADFGLGDCGGGSVSARGSEIAVPTGAIARRHFVSRPEHELLFSNCYLHRDKRAADADFLDRWRDAAVSARGTCVGEA